MKDIKNNPNSHQLDEDDEDNNVYPIPSAVLDDDNSPVDCAVKIKAVGKPNGTLGLEHVNL
jgi:hypothetical protein